MFLLYFCFILAVSKWCSTSVRTQKPEHITCGTIRSLGTTRLAKCFMASSVICLFVTNRRIFQSGKLFCSRLLPSFIDRKIPQAGLMTTIKRFLRLLEDRSKMPAYKTFSRNKQRFHDIKSRLDNETRGQIIKCVKTDVIKLDKSKRPVADFTCFSCPNRKFEQKSMFAKKTTFWKKKAYLPRIVNFMCFLAFPPLYNSVVTSLFNRHDTSYCTFSA